MRLVYLLSFPSVLVRVCRAPLESVSLIEMAPKLLLNTKSVVFMKNFME